MYYLKIALLQLSLLCLLSVSPIVMSAPFKFTYTDTISSAKGPAWVVGETFEIIIFMDNGGTSTISQTWTAADIESITFNINDGANLIVTALSPVVLSAGSGSFVTDGAGTLTAVPEFLVDAFSYSTVAFTNDPDGDEDIRFWINGFNQVYDHSIAESSVNMANVGNNNNPEFWSAPTPGITPIPEPEGIHLTLEEPSSSRPSSGVSNLRGWAVAPNGIDRVELYINGVYIDDIPYGSIRTDVGNAFPDIPNSGDSGFSMAWNYGALEYGANHITLVAYDNIGNPSIAQTDFQVEKFNSDFISNPNLIDLRAVDNVQMLDNNRMLMEGLLVEGQYWDVVLKWQTATQGFDIESIVPSPE